MLKEVCGMTPVAAECTQLVEQYSAEVKALAKQYLVSMERRRLDSSPVLV